MNSSEIIIVWYSVRDNVPASELQAYVYFHVNIKS